MGNKLNWTRVGLPRETLLKLAILRTRYGWTKAKTIAEALLALETHPTPNANESYKARVQGKA